MPSRPDTGICTVCHQRGNLNRNGCVTRHNYDAAWCSGSHQKPVEGSIVHDNGPVGAAMTIQDRIAEMHDYITRGVPETPADLARAHRTLAWFKQQPPTQASP